MSIKNGEGVTADEPLKREDLHPPEPPVAQPRKPEEKKVENNNMYGCDGNNLVTSLLLLGGFGGGRFGGFGGYGGYGGGHGGSRVFDESIVANLKQPSAADHAAQSAAAEARINNLQRDIGGIGRDLQNSLAGINRDLLLHGAQAQAAAEREAAATREKLAECCCETQKEIIGSRFTTELGFKDMTAQLCDVKTTLSAQIAENERERLSRELGDCKAALATANQTTVLSGIVGAAVSAGTERVVGQCCCDPCSNGNGGHGRSSGVSATEVQTIVMNTLSAALAGGNGFTPPGQGGKK